MDDVTLTKKQAAEVSQLLYEYEESNYLANRWVAQAEQQFVAGYSTETLMEAVTKNAYRYLEKSGASLYPTADYDSLCLEVLEIAGIEPPEVQPNLTHGGDITI